MIDLINPVAKEALSQSLEKYFAKWDEYVARMGLYAIAEKMRPVAIGWKVGSRAEYRRVMSVLDNYASQIHSVSVNKRKFATVILDEPLAKNISVIKVIERRDGSRDVVGLDHVDFYLPMVEGIAEILERGEANWRRQGNDAYKRLSVRFGPESLFEAKIIDHTVLNIAADELNYASQKILNPTARLKKPTIE
jgi:predicted metalloenzyme YecM